MESEGWVDGDVAARVCETIGAAVTGRAVRFALGGTGKGRSGVAEELFTSDLMVHRTR